MLRLHTLRGIAVSQQLKKIWRKSKAEMVLISFWNVLNDNAMIPYNRSV